MPFESPTSEQQERFETRRYEYRDPSGKVIANVEARLAPWEETLMDSNEQPRNVEKLVGLRIVNPEDAREMDMLEMFNPHGVDVFVSRNPVTQHDYYADGPNRHVLVPLPSSPVHLATILHELGHIDQEQDEAFKPITELKNLHHAAAVRRFESEDADWYKLQKEELLRMLESMPELMPYIEQEALSALNAATKDNEIYVAMSKLGVAASLPDQMAERDATRRALLWLKRQRERTGVDLLSKTLNPKEDLVDGESACETAVIEGLAQPDQVVDSVVDEMRRWLKSYRADTFRAFRNRDGGVMPSASRHKPKLPPA